jgi:mannosylglycoprotein endo-beta-mannosidase
MLIQLDLEKAYDKISWNYMIKTLEAFGFTQHWISWIASLISTTSYSLLTNGALTKPFWPTRGIIQGDPMSPFLFILMMEDLSRSIKRETTIREITGLRPFENFPTITHQQFFDDTLLYDIPTVKESEAQKHILEDFGEASGAEINHSKSMIFLFNTNPAIQRNLTNILGFERKTLPTKYLGVPLTDKVYKLSTWEGVINMFQEQANN